MRPEIKEYLGIIGGLSQTEKMPGFSWGVPAAACKTGARLAKIPGSACSRCYARKGRYVFPLVRGANERRLSAWRAHRRNWQRFASAMAESIRALDSSGYFRFFDTGDIQDLDMLRAFIRVAELVPDRQFWLPTQEEKLVLRYVEQGGRFPRNLTIRLSSRSIGDTVEQRSAIADLLNLPSSSVSADPDAITCPAPRQGNKCLTCRACWSPNVRHVVYRYH